MRYSKDHKAETHAKIVKRASSQLREKGAHGIGVADLMKEAGLTHGGFYAHFDSREDLLIEAIAYAMDQTTDRWRKLVESKPGDERLTTLIDTYLTEQHRDGPGRGCALSALAPEIARAGRKTRQVFANKLDEMITLFADQMPAISEPAARERAISTVATLVGTLILARVAGNGAFSQEILDAGRLATRESGAKRPSRPRSPKRLTSDRARV